MLAGPHMRILSAQMNCVYPGLLSFWHTFSRIPACGQFCKALDPGCSGLAYSTPIFPLCRMIRHANPLTSLEHRRCAMISHNPTDFSPICISQDYSMQCPLNNTLDGKQHPAPVADAKRGHASRKSFSHLPAPTRGNLI